MKADVRTTCTHRFGPPPPQKWGAWFLLGLTLIGVAMLMDDSVARLLTARPHTEWRALAQWLSQAGEWYYLGAAGVVGSFAFLGQCRFQEARNVMFVTLTGLATGLTGTVVRCLTAR